MNTSHTPRVITALVLAGALSFVAAACGDDSGGTTNDQPATSVMQEHTTDSMVEEHTSDSMMENQSTDAMHDDTTATTTP